MDEVIAKTSDEDAQSGPVDHLIAEARKALAPVGQGGG